MLTRAERDMRKCRLLGNRGGREARLGVRRGSGLAVGLMYSTAWYPHTAKFLQFGGRFDSEGVALARIHILLMSLATLRSGLCVWPRGVGWWWWRLGQVTGGRQAGG